MTLEDKIKSSINSDAAFYFGKEAGRGKREVIGGFMKGHFGK